MLNLYAFMIKIFLFLFEDEISISAKYRTKTEIFLILGLPLNNIAMQDRSKKVTHDY